MFFSLWHGSNLTPYLYILPSGDASHGKAFIVRDEKDEVVAVFVLNFDAVSFDDGNIDDLFSGVLSHTPDIEFEYRENFISKVHHPALEITYLAVREDKRGKGLGKI